MITVVGLGNAPDDRTLRAEQVIADAPYVVVKTWKTAAGKAVKRAKESFDALFDTASDFDALHAAMADRLIALQEQYGGVVYCTDGDGLSDGAVCELVARGADVSFVKGVRAGGAETGGAKLQMTAQSALEIRPLLDGGVALEITEIDDALTAGEVKLYLLEYYSYDTAAEFFVNGETNTIALEDLDRQKKYGVSASVHLRGDVSLCKKRYAPGDLKRIMQRLTAPDGCPWDKEQTHESIRANLIEEAYEAVDAVDAGDLDAMREEFGDVLLQAVFHCDIAERTGEFSAGDVVTELCKKLYSRHTHIFGENRAEDSDQALRHWEAAKAEEKQYVSLYDILARLPKGFPSLLRAEKAYKKALKAGKELAAEPLDEEALAQSLFELVKRAAAAGIDSETALNKKIESYIEGFKE